MIKIETERIPILIWADEADLPGFEEAIAQARNLANHPLARQHVALMPDFHVGYGMPIGGVFATQGGVVPNAVGVDIGCGMIACRTALHSEELDRDMLQSIRQRIHEAVPVGNGPRGNHNSQRELWEGSDTNNEALQRLLPNARKQIGTLGGGNHFIEVQRDEEGRVWLMVHSGSRGIGKQVCDFYDAKARKLMTMVEAPPDRDLAYLPEGSEEFDAYLEAMNWCLRFAEVSRGRMLDATVAAVRDVIGRDPGAEERIETHHNYAVAEQHEGETVLVHRKGAVRASGPVIIPGSMGTASYIARGLDNEASFGTCSHGAGRVMGRKQANRTITHDEAVEAMRHVVFGIRTGDYEEMPQAYKDIHKVMSNQADLVEPLHVLTPLAVVKG
jgi:tRNA-splicing ligase RtcB